MKSYPKQKPYSSSNGYLKNPKGKLINGATVKYGRTIDVYLSKSAFISSGQLYMTTHHEYMHAYFYANNINVKHHKVIRGWHYDQIKAWQNLQNYSRTMFNNSYWNFSSDKSYIKYGFKILKYLP